MAPFPQEVHFDFKKDQATVGAREGCMYHKEAGLSL